ncbi:imelysin family protein [Endozoicomonas elysicola]|uniref:Peptidase n=1 Tax=Endozoicomonas elysicola TaxID=305900 RepID=A0A081K7Z0_9GAMM|nr:imelysin family protein [Endozoicomonas elysicola]KEI70266.1 peptidase [Endozoicomonas elysicola]
MMSNSSLATAGSLILTSALLAGCDSVEETLNTSSNTDESPSVHIAENSSDIIAHYADIALATYEDALITAKALKVASVELVNSPSEESLALAKAAWKAARVPYQQSEVFRFGNPVVDDWEGQLNAWPLDEGLIDYVQSTHYDYEMGNDGALANIISSPELTVSGEKLDLNNLTPQLLADLNELGGSEANVATGYHAVEFLLWGQDLNGTAPGAGNRPATDFSQGADCTGGNCERRSQYLLTALDLLISDLEYMTQQWQPEIKDNYRSDLLSESVDQGFRKMLFGMGSLSLGELAGERMKVALEANSTEDEHDCFSDNTHNSHFYNNLGIRNVYTGQYQRVNGDVITGPSLARLVAEKDEEQALAILTDFDQSQRALQKLVDSAEKDGIFFDQLIASGDDKGNNLVKSAISSLVAQTSAIEEAAGLIGIQQLNPDTADHQF